MKRFVQAFDQCLTVLLLLFVLLQPVSIAGAFIAYSGAALAWLARLALVGDGQLRRSPLDLPILIYWLLCAVSAVVSPLPASAWEGMRKVNLIFLVILVAHNVPNLRRAKQLVVALFLATLFSVAYAGWQLAAGVGLRVNNLKPASALLRAGMRADDVILRVDNRLIRNPDEFSNYLRSKNRDESVRLLVVRDMGFDVLKDAVPLVLPAAAFVGTNNELKVKVGTEHLARARAFYSHPVSYAMVLESLGCLAFGIWLAFRNHSSPTASFGLLGLWLILGLALVATVTRSAWVNFAFGCLLLVWLHERRRWVRVALPVLLILAAVGTNTAMHHWRGVGLVDLHDPGSDYRVQMWRDGLRLIETHPWFGLGMSTVRDAWWKFDLAAYTKYGLRSHFHSTPIQLAVEQGLPVLVAWTILMGSYWLVLIRLVRQAREQRNLLVYGLALGILGGTSAFLASSLVQYNFGDSVVVLQFWFLAGLALALVRQLQMGADSNDFTG